MLQKLKLAYYDTIAPDIEDLLAEFDALAAERNALRERETLTLNQVGKLIGEVDALREALEAIEQEEGRGESPAPVIVARVRRIASAALDGLE